MERDKKISIRLSDEEYNSIQSNAANVGMNVSDYLRSTGLKEMTRVFYDPDVNEALQEIHEYSRTSASALQELSKRNDESFSSTVAFRTASDEIRRMNEKLYVLRVLLEDIKEAQLNGNNEATSNQGE